MYSRQLTLSSSTVYDVGHSSFPCTIPAAAAVVVAAVAVASAAAAAVASAAVSHNPLYLPLFANDQSRK